MDKKQAKERIEELRKKTEYYAQKYYDDDNPEITDFEYDMMMLELRTLESQNPEFITKDSLTQKVGGHVKEGFTKVEHEVPLQSLQDVFNFEEIEAFDERVKKVASENGIDEVKYVVETKIDGLSSALEYKDGKLVRGATRGNGLVGEDVTENLKTIKTIPQELPEKINITVRGEVFISKKEFERMGSTVTGLVESIRVYANFMDNYFISEENKKNHAEIYVEYKEYSKSVYSVLKDNGFIKEKK